MADPKVTADNLAKTIKGLLNFTVISRQDSENVSAVVQEIAQALTLARANADELFVLSVDCELGSGCRKDRTCSGASHWQSYEQIAQEAREEAIQESLKVRSCEDCYASGAEAMRERAAKVADRWMGDEYDIGEIIGGAIRALLPPSAEKENERE
jgi:hypothetical protein